jgi:hypothetical protein
VTLDYSPAASLARPARFARLVVQICRGAARRVQAPLAISVSRSRT